jgi:hypothetical protein
VAAKADRSREEWLRDLRARQEQAAAVEQFGPVSTMLATEGKALGYLQDKVIHEGGAEPIKVINVIRPQLPQEYGLCATESVPKALSSPMIPEGDENAAALPTGGKD